MLFSWCGSQHKQLQRTCVCTRAHITTVLESSVVQQWYKLCITNANKIRIMGWYLLANRKNGHYIIKDLVTFPCRHLLMLNPIYCISISVSLRILHNTPPTQELLCSGAGVRGSSAICFRVKENNGDLLYVVKSFHSLWRWAWKFGLNSKNEPAGENCIGLHFLAIAVRQKTLVS